MNGTLATTNIQTLTIGGSDTGNLVLDGGSGVVRVADLATNGVVYTSNTNGTLNTEAQLSVTRGGTGVNTFGGTNTLLYTTAADSLASLATANNGALITDGTGVPSFSTAGANQILRSNGGGTLAFGSIDLSQSNSVGSSILGVANGGTGADLSSSNAQGSVPFFSSGGVLTSLAPGAAGYVLTTNDTGADPTWVDASSLGTNYLQRNLGTIAPVNITDDLLLGGIATSSARFAFINNIGAGTPTASISANSGNNALYITGNGTLATTNNQTLTIGGSDTGNLVLDGGSGVVRVADLATNGVVYTSNTNGTLNTEAQLSVTRGGTGVNTFGGTNTLLYTTAADSLASLATANNGALITDGTGVPSFSTAGANQILRSNGGGTLAFGSIDLSQSNSVGSSILGVANGGTGADLSSSNAQGSVPFFSSGGVLTSLAPGAAGYVLTTNDTGADPTWVDASSLGTNYLQRNLGTIAPVNITDDLLLGGIATSSARFAFINNIGAGTPTASISANSGNNALYITGNGTLATTNMPNSNNWRK